MDGNLLKFEMGEITEFYTHTSTLTETTGIWRARYEITLVAGLMLYQIGGIRVQWKEHWAEMQREEKGLQTKGPIRAFDSSWDIA